MKHLMRPSIFLLCLALLKSAVAQNIEPAILKKQWKAYWIQVPGEPSNGYGVYLFRKKITLNSKPTTYKIHVSADNRYKLFVNENLVSLGPARSNLEHWNYETVDISSWLNAGENIIAAQVWNEAELRPEAQISFRTGFIMQGATEAEQSIKTDTTWKCIRDDSYRPVRVFIPNVYYVAGPGEQINMATHQKNWKKSDYQDASWKKAEEIFPGNPKGIIGPFGIPVGWLLIPSAIPQMEMKPQRLSAVRKSEGVNVPSSFPASKVAVSIPPNTAATILLDQGFLINAYPTMIFSGGKDGTVSLGYAETLYSKYPEKGNRNEIEGKEFIGRRDSIISDGSNGQQFTSLNWRTYRYIQLRIITKKDPLVIDDLYGTFTGYPFEYKATFDTDNPELKTIMETGWRTARLCAVETYMDCPYYEQLQYIGDARIQALISLFNSGDDRLAKNAINHMDHSRRVEGITESRHPSYSPQFIPTFSLWYIGMLHDFLMYGKDTTFIKNKLPGARQVLDYFHHYQRPDGSLASVPYWMFTDWVSAKEWTEGIAPSGSDSSSALNDLQLLMAYQAASDMELRSGIKEYASLYNKYASQLKSTIRKKYWDASRGLFADRPEKDLFSQHANALAILTGMVTDNEASALAKKILADKDLAPASIYFKYYLHRTLIKAGLGNDYINWLDAWRENLKMGLTTWGEQPDINTTRSDCHAWGASPNIEFLRTVAGIDSDAPGFSKIKIEPHPGSLTDIKCEMPHPKGKISAFYKKENGKWNISIDLPSGTSGSLKWMGKVHALKSGKNEFKF